MIINTDYSTLVWEVKEIETLQIKNVLSTSKLEVEYCSPQTNG